MKLLVLFPVTRFAHALYRPLAYGIHRFRTGKPNEGVAAGLGVAE